MNNNQNILNKNTSIQPVFNSTMQVNSNTFGNKDNKLQTYTEENFPNMNK